jgi:hypothetical protein
MTAVILFPNGVYEFAKIYRATSLISEYILIDTVKASQREYEDSTGNSGTYYKVALSNGTIDQSQVPVKSLVQQVIDNIRIELNVLSSDLSNSYVDFLFDACKDEMMLDICTYYYGIQLSKVTDGVYQLPNRYFFDRNCGGAISPLDFEFFKQTTPIYIYSEKTPVTPIFVDPEERYVELAEPLASNEILKVSYYSIGRKIKPQLLVKLLSYKICSTYFNSLSVNNSKAQTNKIKIGDISIQTGSQSASSNVDAAIKMTAKYKQLITSLKSGFVRTN